MRLCVDYVAAGRFLQAGAEVPLQLLPPAVRKYAEGGSGDLEPEPAAVKLARRSFKRRKGVRCAGRFIVPESSQGASYSEIGRPLTRESEEAGGEGCQDFDGPEDQASIPC
jgi:hypothetical protein